MPPSIQAPIDYTTYQLVLKRATLRKDLRGLPTVEAALRSLMQEERHYPEYAAAYARYTSAQTRQTRTAVTKQAAETPPARPGQERAPTPPPSAREDMMARIAKRQAEEPGLSFLEASDRVNDEDPDLHAQYVFEARYPGRPYTPVEKAVPPTYEQVLKMATDRAAQTPGLTCREAMTALAQEDPARYYEAYRRYHVSDGVQEHEDAMLAKHHAGKVS